MPGPSTQDRPRAHRLTDIEPQTAKGLGCNRADDFSTPVSSGSNMSSIARFPKLDECAHFHYEHVELGTLEVSVNDGSNDSDSYAVRITSGDACWTLQRSYDNFVMFDKQLHRCIFDRKFSSLTKLPDIRPKNACDILKDYLSRFSQLNHEGLNCGPVLNWLQLDNRGRRILVPESDSCPINTPAVAAAYAVRPYTAQAQDEISFQVGDMISVIDMPPPGESTWWRGKHGFAVGFFPAECVAVIGDKVPRHLTVSTTVRSRLPVKPVLRKHGKLIAFFRSFILNRPSRRRLKQSGILRERVFGCDLGEHLLNSGQDVPTVLTCCAEFIEKHGLVDGIYRLSGVTSNIQKLRNAFDEDRVPALHSDESILQDIHSVASLLKMYFRELPNPLCTYQLYSTFVSAVQAGTDAERLRRMRDAVRKLPPPHYRTLEYLMRHLVRVAARGTETGMTPRNVAIVWAPNLLRCKELEVGGVAALQGVGVQAVVTEFLVCYAELIFGDGPVGRPKSLAITTSARLLTLEEARNRSLRGEPDYIEVGAGPAGLPLRYHTVIELPRKRNGSKRSPSLNWRALFGRGALGAMGKTRQIGTPPQAETVPSSLNSLRRLRPVKSADSLDGEDSLGPLLGPPPTRTCGHSRSVSHDSYFDHLADAPSAPSPLDLSEIQLNFDLEEREMRMFSEEEGGGVASVEASPRRQRTDGSQCTAVTGGSKRKRSRLEERLHCDVELRFIDSQSPDQVMVATSADIHSIDTPSPLPTPGYLPLLSEASTPLTPATLQTTSHSPSPVPANSPRISFRSFTLPLEIDDERSSSSANKLTETSASSEKSPEPVNHRLSINLEERDRGIESSEGIPAYDGCMEKLHDRKRTITNSLSDAKSQAGSRLSTVFNGADAPCDNRLSAACRETSESSGIVRKDAMDGLSKSHDGGETASDVKKRDEPTDSQNNLNAVREANLPRLPLSNTTDLDSPMSCEQTLQELQESGFVICDSTDKVFTNTETPRLIGNTNDSGEWVIIGRTAGSLTTPISEPTSPNNSFLESNPTIAIATQLRPTSDNVSEASLDLALTSTVDAFRLGKSVENRVSQQESEEMILDVADTKESASREHENQKGADRTGFDLENESNLVDDLENESHARLHDRENGNRYSCDTTSADINSSQEANNLTREQQIRACYAEADNANVFGRNQNEARETKEVFRETFESYHRLSRDTSVRRVNHSRLSGKTEEDKETNRVTRDDRDNNERCSNGLSEKCQSFGYNSSQKAQQTDSQQQQRKCTPSKRSDTNDSHKCVNIQAGQMASNVEVRIPSENAAEPCEVAHVPEGASETMERTIDASSTFSNVSSPSADDETIVLRDTATILQELALQRLSGGAVADLSSRRRYENETSRDRRSFDSEIGREIVRERKIRQELDCARGKSEEPSQHLPPCLRARHARSTRAALSRSLDEAKFNRMTGEIALSVKQTSSEDAQHCSTPNVGSGSGACSNISEKIQLKNLGGLDLGDPQCRERIEKYKEERRTFLRDKYRSESFRGISSRTEDDGEQALLNRLKQRASRPSLH